jgi:hypothetical protein
MKKDLASFMEFLEVQESESYNAFKDYIDYASKKLRVSIQKSLQTNKIVCLEDSEEESLGEMIEEETEYLDINAKEEAKELGKKSKAKKREVTREMKK